MENTGLQSSLADRFSGTLDSLDALCHELEMLADRLPGDVDKVSCTAIAERIVPAIRDAHAFENEVVYATLQDAIGTGQLEQTLRRLRHEHVEDEGYAEEIAEILQSFAAGAPGAAAESIGYMLRGFFESKRRHIAFERDHILPMLIAAGKSRQ
jgi:hypothetical protein